MKYGLAPVVDDASRVVVLGSLPGEQSLRRQEYYAHPQNQFWRIMSAVVGEPLPDGYEERCAMLLRHSIALWDVIHYAERQGSLDASIKNPEPNDFGAFFKRYPKIRRVILNGDKAAAMFKKQFGQIAVETFKVPSTSPARANLSLEEKEILWRAAFE